jgi:hypothetical protein
VILRAQGASRDLALECVLVSEAEGGGAEGAAARRELARVAASQGDSSVERGVACAPLPPLPADAPASARLFLVRAGAAAADSLALSPLSVPVGLFRRPAVADVIPRLLIATDEGEGSARGEGPVVTLLLLARAAEGNGTAAAPGAPGAPGALALAAVDAAVAASGASDAALGCAFASLDGPSEGVSAALRVADGAVSCALPRGLAAAAAGGAGGAALVARFSVRLVALAPGGSVPIARLSETNELALEVLVVPSRAAGVAGGVRCATLAGPESGGSEIRCALPALPPALLATSNGTRAVACRVGVAVVPGALASVSGGSVELRCVAPAAADAMGAAGPLADAARGARASGEALPPASLAISLDGVGWLPLEGAGAGAEPAPLAFRF